MFEPLTSLPPISNQALINGGRKFSEINVKTRIFNVKVGAGVRAGGKY